MTFDLGYMNESCVALIEERDRYIDRLKGWLRQYGHEDCPVCGLGHPHANDCELGLALDAGI